MVRPLMSRGAELAQEGSVSQPRFLDSRCPELDLKYWGTTECPMTI
jgi:hypothetical protein